MKRMLLTAAGLLLSVCFVAGCSTAQQADVAQKAQFLHAQVAKACSVVQPTLLSVKAMEVADPAQEAVFSTLADLNGKVCTAGAAVDPSSVSTLINTSIPAALQVVALVPMDPATKMGVQIGLIAFQTALSAALVQYGPVGTVSQ
jgi:outer membrane murein-binding lipoprotein Lpp